MNVVALVISILSLVIAASSLFLSLKPRRLQNEVNESNILLNEQKLSEQKKYEGIFIDAEIKRDGSKDYYLDVYNLGKSTAFNVSVSINSDSGMLLCGNDIMPYEILESKHDFRVPLIIIDNSKPKCTVYESWEDENQEEYHKEQTIAIY